MYHGEDNEDGMRWNTRTLTQQEQMKEPYFKRRETANYSGFIKRRELLHETEGGIPAIKLPHYIYYYYYTFLRTR